jgi:hypothetical protein
MFTKFKRLPLGQITLGLLVIISILIVFAPVSMPAFKSAWTPLSLSAPDWPNDLVSSLPRANGLTTGQPTETFSAHYAIVRKITAFPLWALISSLVVLTFRLIIARFVRVIRNITWFHYLFHLLDLPPPSSVPASV